MPYSSWDGKNEIGFWLSQNTHKISKVLDIGIGCGTYYDLYNGAIPQAFWEGIEVWTPYIQRFNLESKYSKVYNVDVRTIDWNAMDHYSVIFAGDVMEHMSKHDAEILIEKILHKCDVLIISIPLGHWPQEAWEGNPYEAHIKDNWTHDEVLSTWNQYISNAAVTGTIGVYWLNKKPEAKMAA